MKRLASYVGFSAVLVLVCLSFIVRSVTGAEQRSASVPPLTKLHQESIALWDAFEAYRRSATRSGFGYSARVERLELLPDGTTRVHFRAERAWKTSSNSLGDQKASHEKLMLMWLDRERPPPFCQGLRVGLATDAQKVVRSFFYGGGGSKLYAIRQRPNGEYEFILRVGEDHPDHPLIRLYPQKCDFGTPEVHWTDRYGMFMVLFEAGGDDREIEGLRGGTGGFPIANEPGKRVSVGRDGWIDFEKWTNSLGKSVHGDPPYPSTPQYLDSSR